MRTCRKKVEGIECKYRHTTIERHYICPYCGYHRHWAYGSIMPDDSEYDEVTE